MEKTILKLKALASLEDEYMFDSELWATNEEGEEVWVGDDDLCLSKAQILHLIAQAVGDEALFAGLQMEEVDVEEQLRKLAEELYEEEEEDEDDDDDDEDDEEEEDDDDDEEDSNAIKLKIVIKFDDSNHDGLQFAGRCETIASFVNAWVTLFGAIDAGKVTTNNLLDWVAYFADSDNYNRNIEAWVANAGE